jgi:hypothetical protein
LTTPTGPPDGPPRGRTAVRTGAGASPSIPGTFLLYGEPPPEQRYLSCARLAGTARADPAGLRSWRCCHATSCEPARLRRAETHLARLNPSHAPRGPWDGYAAAVANLSESNATAPAGTPGTPLAEPPKARPKAGADLVAGQGARQRAAVPPRGQRRGRSIDPASFPDEPPGIAGVGPAGRPRGLCRGAGRCRSVTGPGRPATCGIHKSLERR